MTCGNGRGLAGAQYYRYYFITLVPITGGGHSLQLIMDLCNPLEAASFCPCCCLFGSAFWYCPFGTLPFGIALLVLHFWYCTFGTALVQTIRPYARADLAWHPVDEKMTKLSYHAPGKQASKLLQGQGKTGPGGRG